MIKVKDLDYGASAIFMAPYQHLTPRYTIIIDSLMNYILPEKY